jgi:predicted transcriptional regulator
MKEFENLIEGNDTVHYKSRIVASYINEGGNINSRKFKEYLDKLVELGWIESKDVQDVIYYARNGKLELEMIARQILKEEK